MRSHTQRLMVCAASFAALCMGLAGCGSNTASTGGDSGEVVNLTYMHRLPDSEGMTLVKDIGTRIIRTFRSRPPSSMVPHKI